MLHHRHTTQQLYSPSVLVTTAANSQDQQQLAPATATTESSSNTTNLEHLASCTAALSTEQVTSTCSPPMRRMKRKTSPVSHAVRIFPISRGPNQSLLSAHGILMLTSLSGAVLLGCSLLVGYHALSSSSRIFSSVSSQLDSTKRQIMSIERSHQQQDQEEEESPIRGIHVLPFNSLYKVQNAMNIVGDRSDRYARLRQEVDARLSDDIARSTARVQELRHHSFHTMPMEPHNSDQLFAPYDIYDCPDTPPHGYPFEWNLLQILDNWPTDDTTPRSNVYNALCVFDYTKDYDKAMIYRNAELPFVVVNDPEVHKTVERWHSPGYMERMLSDGPHRCEVSPNNHFMYFVPPKKQRANGGNRNTARKMRGGIQAPEGWKPPTEGHRMHYTEWLQHANVTDQSALGTDQTHWYFRLIGCGLMGNDGRCDAGSSEYLYDELPFFQPKPSLYIRDETQQKGIHCRFGMQGVIAENHFDVGRNSIALLGGTRRYILAHPNQCNNLALYPKGHPSARHSAVDWSNPNITEYPQFAQAKGNEVVMQAGQVLYLPTNWFHYIISLELNFQCNTRSGYGPEYPLHFCGF